MKLLFIVIWAALLLWCVFAKSKVALYLLPVIGLGAVAWLICATVSNWSQQQPTTLEKAEDKENE